jgi:hypothetical protein
MNKFDMQLEKVTIIIAILQILALLTSCGIVMYLTSKNLYLEQIYIVPLHIIFIVSIIYLNKKWLNNISNENRSHKFRE